MVDPRFIQLCIELGDRELAIGVAVNMFQAAQTYWAPNKSPIPNKIYDKLRCADLWLKIGLAKRVKRGTYILGSRDQFAWLIQKHEASRKALESRKKNTTVRSPEATGRSPSTLLYSTHNYVNNINESITPDRAKKRQRNLEKIEKLKQQSIAAVSTVAEKGKNEPPRSEF